MMMFNTVLTPGERLRASRTYAGMTMAELADQVNEISNGRRRCRKSVISDQERGEKGISPEYAELYGKIFDVDPAYFTGDSDCMNSTVKQINENARESKENNIIDNILAYSGYRVERRETWSADLMPEKVFYNLYKVDGSRPLVCLDQNEFYAFQLNIINMVQAYVQTVIKMGKTLPDRVEEVNQILIAAGSGD